MEGTVVADAKASPMVRLLAFVERAVGMHPRAVPDMDLERRAARALADLEDGRSDLRRQVAIEHLRREWDLFSSEAALNPVVLALQVRAFALAKTEPVLAVHLAEAQREPIVKLFDAIVSQAMQGRAMAIRIGFTGQGPSFIVHFQLSDGWKEATTLPTNLIPPLKGAALVREATRTNPFLVDASFVWEEGGDLVIEFESQTAGPVAG